MVEGEGDDEKGCDYGKLMGEMRRGELLWE